MNRTLRPERFDAWVADGSSCPPPSFDPQDHTDWLVWDAPNRAKLDTREHELAAAMDAGIIAYGVSLSGRVAGVGIDTAGVVLVGQGVDRAGRPTRWLTSRRVEDHVELSRILPLVKWPKAIPETTNRGCVALLSRRNQCQGERSMRWLDNLIERKLIAHRL